VSVSVYERERERWSSMKVPSCDRGRSGRERQLLLLVGVVDPLIHSATEYDGEVRVSKEWEGWSVKVGRT
jgi:hypothetical protein